MAPAADAIRRQRLAGTVWPGTAVPADVVNGRFKGGYITRHYGAAGVRAVHAVQLEMCQNLYMRRDAAVHLPALDAAHPCRSCAPCCTPRCTACEVCMAMNRAVLHAHWAWLDSAGRPMCCWRSMRRRPLATVHTRVPAGPGTTRTAPDRPGAARISCNAHSHAFQRAIAGLTEQRGRRQGDDFWSWRERMYAVALRITPAQLERRRRPGLYAELLAGGYTQVCEFHYLHNAAGWCSRRRPAGRCPWRWCGACASAVGIGLTLLPALYMRAGLTQQACANDQRCFASTPQLRRRLARCAVCTRA
jgi:hypothetical protein